MMLRYDWDEIPEGRRHDKNYQHQVIPLVYWVGQLIHYGILSRYISIQGAKTLLQKLIDDGSLEVPESLVELEKSIREDHQQNKEFAMKDVFKVLK